mgnify:CR=1 FL=1
MAGYACVLCCAWHLRSVTPFPRAVFAGCSRKAAKFARQQAFHVAYQLVMLYLDRLGDGTVGSACACCACCRHSGSWTRCATCAGVTVNLTDTLSRKVVVRVMGFSGDAPEHHVLAARAGNKDTAVDAGVGSHAHFHGYSGQMPRCGRGAGHATAALSGCGLPD